MGCAGGHFFFDMWGDFANPHVFFANGLPVRAMCVVVLSSCYLEGGIVALGNTV